MKENLKILAVAVIFLLIGLISGKYLFYQANNNQIINESFSNNLKEGNEINMSVVNATVNFISKNLVRESVKVEMMNVSIVSGNFYKIKLKFIKDGNTLGEDTVLVSEDGKSIYLREIVVEPQPKKEGKSKFESLIEGRPYVGNESAKVIIVLFSDFACPYCAKLETEVLPKILEKYGDKIKIVFRDFPVHKDLSILTSTAALCANEQGKYWEYRELLFKNQKEWMKADLLENTSILVRYAAELGLDTKKFEECIKSGKYRDQILADFNKGRELGVKGTPTMFINGNMYVGYMGFDELSKIIEKMLKQI